MVSGLFISDLVAAIVNESENDLQRPLAADSATINERICGTTALGLSADWPQGIKMLLEAGADVNLKDSFGNSPIEYACERECSLSAQLLLDVGCDLDHSHFFHCLDFDDRCGPEANEARLAIIEGLAGRRRELQKLAETALPKHVLEELKLPLDSLLD